MPATTNAACSIRCARASRPPRRALRPCARGRPRRRRRESYSTRRSSKSRAAVPERVGGAPVAVERQADAARVDERALPGRALELEVACGRTRSRRGRRRRAARASASAGVRRERLHVRARRGVAEERAVDGRGRAAAPRARAPTLAERLAAVLERSVVRARSGQRPRRPRATGRCCRGSRSRRARAAARPSRAGRRRRARSRRRARTAPRRPRARRRARRRAPAGSRGCRRGALAIVSAGLARWDGWPSPGHGASTSTSRESSFARTSWRSFGSVSASRPGRPRTCFRPSPRSRPCRRRR